MIRRMGRRTRIWAAVTIALGLTLLVGCNQPLPKDASTDQNGGTVYGEIVERKVSTQDGREVMCLFWVDPNNSGGLSCDWAEAKR